MHQLFTVYLQHHGRPVLKKMVGRYGMSARYHPLGGIRCSSILSQAKQWNSRTILWPWMGGIRFMIVFGTGLIRHHTESWFSRESIRFPYLWLNYDNSQIKNKIRLRSFHLQIRMYRGRYEVIPNSFQIQVYLMATLSPCLHSEFQCPVFHVTWSTIWIPAALSKKNVIVLNAFPPNTFIFNQCNNQNHLEWIIVVLIIITIMLNTRDIGKMY